MATFEREAVPDFLLARAKGSQGKQDFFPAVARREHTVGKMGTRLLTKAEPLRCQPEGQNGNQAGALRSRQNLSRAVTVEEIFAVSKLDSLSQAMWQRQKAYMCRPGPGHFSLTRNMIEIENQNLLSRLF